MSLNGSQRSASRKSKYDHSRRTKKVKWNNRKRSISPHYNGNNNTNKHLSVNKQTSSLSLKSIQYTQKYEEEKVELYMDDLLEQKASDSTDKTLTYSPEKEDIDIEQILDMHLNQYSSKPMNTNSNRSKPVHIKTSNNDVLGLDPTLDHDTTQSDEEEYEEIMTQQSTLIIDVVDDQKQNISYSPKHISLSLVQSDTNIHELDDCTYDLLSESVCALFYKLDTNNQRSVTADVIKIGFSLLDINLSDHQFNAFIDEITNFQSHKRIKLDMMRSFVLNIQHKDFDDELNQIRMQIINGFLHQTLLTPNPDNRRKIVSFSSSVSPRPRSHQKSTSASKIYSKSPRVQSKQSNAMRKRKKRKQSQTPKTDKHTQPMFFQRPIRAKSYHMNSSISPRERNLNDSMNTDVDLRTRRFSKNVSNNERDQLQIHHVTDHDSLGLNQYNLLLCTLKYSLICSVKELYHTDSLSIDEDKLDKWIRRQAQKQAIGHLFEALYDFMSMNAEVMTLEMFTNAMKSLKISCDRRDVLIICFKELSAPKKSFITKQSFVCWIIEQIYTAHNAKHYANYKKHYHKYYKWIEHDLFALVSSNDDNVSVASTKKTKKRKKRPQSSR